MEQFNKPSSSSSLMESIRKLTNPDVNSGSETPKSTSSLTWSDLHPASPVYESPSFADVLAGSPAIPAVSSLTLSPTKPTQENRMSFRSPPAQTSSSLMELQTVTPSRVGISPKAIIKKVDENRQETDEVPPLSSIFLPQDLLPPEPQRQAFSLSNLTVHSSTATTSTPSTKAGMQQFRIVIGGESPETTTHEGSMNMETDDTSNQQHDQSKTKPRTITFSHDSDDEVDRRNVKDIQQDLNIDQDLLAESRKAAKKGTSTKLPRELRGLMGEANLRYARGEHEVTIKMCLEVIRLAPYAAEPFETLAMIYEERGETKKALQYSLLAAHVSPTDAEQWVHLAQLCLQQNDQFKALNCFCKAFNADRSNAEVALQCAEMYKDFGSCSSALPKYKAAMAATTEPDKAMQLARDAAKSFHAKGENWLGAEMLEEAMTKHPPLFKDEDMNMLCELLLLCGKFGHVLRALMKHSGIVLRFEDEMENRNSDEDYSGLVGISIPNSLAVDLRCKLAVAMIRLHKSQMVEDMVQNICEHDPADIGDLQFDLAETYMDVKDYRKALSILDLLIASPRYGLAAVWLRHADCCELCGETEKALFSYRQCINLAPGYVHTYLVYSSVLRKLGRFDIAIQALDEASGYECTPKLRMKLHIERYNVLKAWGESGRKDKLSSAADEALLMLAKRLKTSFVERMLLLVRRQRPSQNPLAGDVMVVRQKTTGEKSISEPVTTDKGLASDGNTAVLNKDEWMQIFEVTMEMLVTCSRFRDAAKLGEAAQYLSVWSDNPTYRLPIDYITFSACMLGRLYPSAYTYIKSWVKQHPEKNQLWNLFCQVTDRTGDQRHHRFCLRYLSRLPEHFVLGVLSGHILLASGSYRNALSEYVRAHKKKPDDALLVMLVGIMFIHIACQKFSEQKNSLIVQGLAFLQKYMKMRGVSQESYYNIGRSLHQLSLEHFAVHYYERALRCPPPAVREETGDGKMAPLRTADDDSVFDLKCEVAYNLSLIYRRSGNHAVANEVLMKHCVI